MAGARRGPLVKSDPGSRRKLSTSTDITICPASELPVGEQKIIEADGVRIGVFRIGEDEVLAIEDRCSHDDGPLAEGEFDRDACTVECPRHGSLFDLRTGRPKTLPAFTPVQTFAARIEDDEIKLEL